MKLVNLKRMLSVLKKIFAVYVSCQLLVLEPLSLFAESIAYARPEQKTYSLKGLFAKLRGGKKEASRDDVESVREVAVASQAETESVDTGMGQDSSDSGRIHESSSSKSSGFEGTQRIAPVSENVTESTLPSAVISLGGRTSEDDSDAFVDVLAPVLGKDSQFLFINPRATLAEESANEQNVGAGIRRIILDDHLIVGGNIFYDTRESERNFHYEQLGLGLELLTDWVDARANYYLPNNNGDRNAFDTQDTEESQTSIHTDYSQPFFTEHEVRQTKTRTVTTTTTDHHFDKFESAMQGADVEVGVKIPIVSNIAETRVFGGYYLYNSNFGKDIQGFKARLEVRAVPALILDAEWYEDKEIHGTDYYVGARARLPFDVGNLFTGKNPFEGTRDYFKRGTQTLKSRMTDMVMRDIDIVLEESDFIEDLNRLTVTTTVEVNVYNVTLMDDITFVNGNNKKKENGTFENPFDTIQEGVDHAFGDKLVYVGFAEDYLENVKLRDGVKLWGSGYVIFGIEDGIHGVKPTVNGQSLGPAITMADNSEVWGFHVINQNLGGPAQMRTVAGQNYDISRVGIYAENKNDLKVVNGNLLEANSTAILFASDTRSKFESDIRDNTIQFNDNGIKIFGQGPGGTGNFSTQIQDNTIQSSGAGIQIATENFFKFSAEVIDNNLTENSLGILIESDTNSGGTSIEIRDNDVSGNTGTNIEMNVTGNSGDVDIDILNNDASNSSNLLGILLKTDVTNADTNISIQDNLVNNSAFENMKLELDADGGDIFLNVLNNQSSNSASSIGMSLDAQAVNSGNINLQIGNNIINNNGGFANFLGNIGTQMGNIDADISNNQSSNGAGLGILLNAASNVSGSVNVNILNNMANGNTNENMLLNLDTTSGDINALVDNNQASNSNASIGMNLQMTGNGAGSGINATISNNIANDNNGFANILVDLDSNADNINVTADNNQASLGSSLGMILNATANGSGAVTANVTNNIANNNNNENILMDLDSAFGDVTALVNNNQASNSNASIGMNLQMTGNGAGSGINAIISNNIANDNNGFANILMDLDSNADNINVTADNNQASLGSSLGMILNATANASGAVTANVTNNIANNNNNENILMDLDSAFGDVTALVDNNQASNSNASIGMNLQMTGNGAGSGINATISNNIANDNNGFANMLIDLDSNSDNILITLDNNQASNGSTLGILLNATVAASGGITATVSNNIANANSAENIKIDLDSVAADINVTVSSNQASNSTGSSGLVLEANANGGAGNVNVLATGNVTNTNAAIGFDVNLVSPDDITFTATSNTANGNIGGGTDGMNIFVDAGTGVGDDVRIYGESNVFRNNGNDGVELNMDSGSATYTVDFGGGGLTSPGNNSFTNNTGIDFHDVSPAIGGLTIFAGNNFWVDTTPDSGDEYLSDNANTIDVTGALAVDPNP